jgi:hypothetical protein
MRAPPYYPTKRALFTAPVDVREISVIGRTNDLSLPAGVGFDDCEYRLDSDGTFSLRLSNSVRITRIPPLALALAVEGPQEVKPWGELEGNP